MAVSRTLQHPDAMLAAMADSDHLLDALRLLTGRPTADFRDGQREAIEALVNDRARVLVVQRTGWGKSAVYFLTTHLLRQQGFGPTLLISPLLALMRNQIEAATRLGLRCQTVNSASNTTDRVVDDVASQLGAQLTTFRGPLRRDGLSLNTLRLDRQAERLAWLAE